MMNEFDKFMNENQWSIISFILFECMLVLCAIFTAVIGAWGLFAAIITIIVIPIMWAIVFLLIVNVVVVAEKSVDNSSESV